MPAGFDRCRAAGGKIRTVKPNANTYIHICYLGGKSYRGEIKHTQNKGKVNALAKRS
jgi:hypothetical protein